VWGGGGGRAQIFSPLSFVMVDRAEGRGGHYCMYNSSAVYLQSYSRMKQPHLQSEGVGGECPTYGLKTAARTRLAGIPLRLVGHQFEGGSSMWESWHMGAQEIGSSPFARPSLTNCTRTSIFFS